MRISEDGTAHPEQSDVPDTEGILHIGECDECKATFPVWADIEEWARYSDPQGYEKAKAEIAARRT